ncbi:hydrolase [Streptomyces violaceusniger]|uniref:HAD family acid phosphatase n=2 Tax=Streptomyces violaceusniger group TaxID=2839105 RepID=A0ABD5JDV1_9ACTN|nr:HAD family acid phosphatase [Streptomyces violaceusniger]KUL46670.1 hydrolase [Streptomyces violaceusniger]MEE4586571.1 HAD family acid phosphatase [Streptomyces sp. DSM 41602]
MAAGRVRSRRLGMTTVIVALAIGVGGTATTATAATANPVTPGTTATTPAAAAPSSATAAEDVDYETWQRDVRAIIDEQARPYIEERTAGPSGEKQAIVLDIDNTSLETDFGFTFPQPPVEPVLKLSQYAHDRGVALFFVTARPGIVSWPTEYNLEKVGYSVAGLYVRHLPDLFQNVADYKTAKRAEIEKDGYTIIANIGNSPTDISGGHAEKSFKLPDYDGRLS